MLNSGTALLISADRHLMRLVERSLSEEGWQFVQVESAARTGDIAQAAHSIDLVLIDGRLCERGADAGCQILRALDSWEHVPLVLLADASAVETDLPDGIDDLVFIPGEREHLRQRLRPWLQLRKIVSAQVARREDQVRFEAATAIANTVADRINNPLAAIAGLAELLATHEHDPVTRQEYCARLVRAAERMADTVRQLTSITRFASREGDASAIHSIDLDRAACPTRSCP